MKQIRILSIRKNTNPHVESLEKEYLKRLKPKMRIQIDDIRQAYPTKVGAELILEQEVDIFLKKISPKERLIVLHESGRQLTSPEFSIWITGEMQTTAQPLTFLIGSAYGVHHRILSKAHLVLSLSKMTFTHEHARLLLLEQLYRGIDIASGGNYHK